MKNRALKGILIITILQLFNMSPLIGQADSCWTVLLLKKGHELREKEDMASFQKDGFYMYRNCVYQIKTQDNHYYDGRLIDIQPDTLFFTNCMSEDMALAADVPFDTIGLHYKQLSKLRLISDRSLGLYSSYSLDKFNFIFQQDTAHCSRMSYWSQIYTNDTTLYELVPHLTDQGVGFLYEEGGRAYYFYGGGMTKPDASQIDSTYRVKNGLGLTPCKVEKINGLAFGLFAENMKNYRYNTKDSLEVNGLNIEVNPFGIFSLMSARFTGPYPDSIEYYHEHLKKDIETTINGVNLSLVNTINETQVNGVNITGLVTVVDEIDGCSFSGLSNFAYELKGVSIAGFYNRATVAKGVQIGLVNKTSDLRGFQFGLWNTNGRRSLPFINWQFREKKSK